MLAKSDTDIAATLAHFNTAYLDVCFLVPTDTAMDKGIMDATETVRKYLASQSFHDYSKQEQASKEIRKAYFVFPDSVEETKVSLYRPKTKKGDPRIWVYGMNKYANPFNLLAVFVHKGALYLVNCSREEIVRSIYNAKSPLANITKRIARVELEDDDAMELLERLRAISAKGFIKTRRKGNTGVGMTLETELGIAANSREEPDFGNIELKASRLGRGSNKRVTLFSQVPVWDLSPVGEAWNLLEKHGYRSEKSGRLQLYHTLDCVEPNSLGFVLELDSANKLLKQHYEDEDTKDRNHLTTWSMERLSKKLVTKHANTFWVDAEARGRGADEEFHYVSIKHTHSPKVQNFEMLLEGGTITLDFLIHAQNEAKKKVRDHGYLFKIKPTDFVLLFPPAKVYELV